MIGWCNRNWCFVDDRMMDSFIDYSIFVVTHRIMFCGIYCDWKCKLIKLLLLVFSISISTIQIRSGDAYYKQTIYIERNWNGSICYWDMFCGILVGHIHSNIVKGMKIVHYVFMSKHSCLYVEVEPLKRCSGEPFECTCPVNFPVGLQGIKWN